MRKFYDYDEHSRVGAKHGEFVTDEICDRFCVLGNAEQATAKLKELESIGVDQFNIYLMTHGQEDDLAAYGRDIIPQFAECARPNLAGAGFPDRARTLRQPLSRDECARRARSRRARRPSRRRVLAVEDRVHLDDLERAGEPGLGDELEREVRLAVGEPTAHGRPDTGRDVGIEHVHVERDVDEAARPAIRSSDSRTARSMPMRSISLIVNTRTPASRSSRRSPSSSWRTPDERDPLRRRPREAATLALEARRRRGPSAAASAMPWTLPRRARLGRVDVRVRVDPENAARPVHRREPAERAERDRVVAAEDERQRAAVDVASATRAAISSHVSWISGRKRARSSRSAVASGDGRLDVALVAHVVPEALRAAPRAPRSGSPTGPCRRRAGPARGRAAHR